VLFARVVEAGGFSGAARALGMPKATLSRNIARLEADLGVRLLHRTTRKVELTALGRTYYDDAVRGLAHLESANERIAATQSVPSGTLRITAPPEFGLVNLMEWIPEFLATHDKINIELILRDELLDLVAHRIDVAFRTGRLASSSYVARKLSSSRRILMASPRYLARRGTPRRVDDLYHHDCVLFGPSLEHTVWRLDGPSGTREVPVRGRIAVDSARAALRATVGGLGIALLPAGLAPDDLARGAVRQILPRYGVAGGGLYVVYPSNRHPSAALRTFLDFCDRRLSSK